MHGALALLTKSNNVKCILNQLIGRNTPDELVLAARAVLDDGLGGVDLEAEHHVLEDGVHERLAPGVLGPARLALGRQAVARELFRSIALWEKQKWREGVRYVYTQGGARNAQYLHVPARRR